jgi:uncharacterized protein YggU (UPF0235/DUF167 family)
MFISVVVHTNANNPRVEGCPTKVFHMYVNALPSDGKANRAVVDALAKHFDTQKSRVVLVKGMRSRNKIIEIR